MTLGKIIGVAAGVWLAAAAAAAVLKPVVHVETVGTGPVQVVLIPGFMFDWTMWSGFMERNKERYTMHALTLPGFGGSDAPPLQPDEQEIPWLDSATEAVAAMIKEKGIKDPVVLGHSLGGHIALRLGFEAPEVVSKVISAEGMPAYVLGAAALSPMQRATMVNRDYAPRMHAVTEEEWAAQLSPMIHSMVASEADGKALYSIAAQTKKDTAIEYYLELIKSDITPWMFKMKRPAMAIAAVAAPDAQGASASDPVKRAWREQMAPAEGSQVVFFEGARHFLMYDMPEDFDRAIAEFIGGKQVKGAVRAADAAPSEGSPGASPGQGKAPSTGVGSKEQGKKKPILPPSPRPGTKP